LRSLIEERMFRGFVYLVIFGSMTAGVGFAQSAQPSQPSAPGAAAGSSDSSAAGQPKQVRKKEDWTKLAVDRKTWQPNVGGVSLGKSETEKYSSELVRLLWRPQDPIDIWIIKPRGVEKPRVALYLYTFPDDIDRFMDESWRQGATQNGLAAVGFISALTGERVRGNRPMREWFVRELQESMASSAHDAQLIIDYLAQRGDLNVDQVGIFGQGSGGAIAILAAAADPRIRAVDVLNPWGDWPDWLKSSPVVPDDQRGEFMAPEFLQKATVVEPVAYLPSLKDRALRVQQILDYPNTPPAARDKIAATVPAGDLVQYKDRTAHAEAWKKTGLSGWLASALGSKP